MKIVWIEEGWEDYIYWQKNDKKTLKKVNSLIQSILRDPFKGTGKPEPLKENLSGWWSRRINLKDRIVYRIEEDKLIILQCRFHY